MALLEEVFNHVVLPPRLPGKQDKDPDIIARDLTTRLLRACQTLEELTDNNFGLSWRNVAILLQTSLQVNDKFVDQRSLLNGFGTVASVAQVLVCYVNEQNAGLLMHRKALKNGKYAVVFEAFEASPTTKTVLAAPNALRWNFPDRAVRISDEDFQDTQFQESLALFLSKASSEYLTNFAAKATKAGQAVPEIRNPSDPALITHMLLSVLEAMGSSSKATVIRKRVRDDVHLHGGEMPWRRLPFWLVLRVAVQRQLTLCFGGTVGYVAYKLFLCTTYTALLEDCILNRMHPSQVLLLQKKLGRKLAKLEACVSTYVDNDDKAESINKLMSSTCPLFEKVIAAATAYAESAYASFKNTAARHVGRLPLRADDAALRLALPSSGPYLATLLRNAEGTKIAAKAVPHSMNLAIQGGLQKTSQFAEETLDASRLLRDATAVAPSWKELHDTSWKKTAISEKINDAVKSLVALATRIPPSEPIHASSVLLGIFELWAKMDSIAVSVHPMLADYAPFFRSDLLNVLQLPALSDMWRLRYIQGYINCRFAECKMRDRTIFGTLDDLCLGSRFVKESHELEMVYEAIKGKEIANRLNKKEHWESLCNQYDQLTNDMALPCSCTFGDDGYHNHQQCISCSAYDKRKRMRIKVCEDLLPSDENLARAVVFELRLPKCVALYRSTTWRILTQLAYPRLPPVNNSPKKLLLGITQLSPFSAPVIGSIVTLGSRTKSFGQTHYKKPKMKVPLKDVLVPLASTFQLFDTASERWVSDFGESPTLAHRCCVHVPRNLRDSVLPAVPHPPMYSDGPSSYATVASRPECPPELSIHEFEAFQRLLSGRSRRWFTLLVELAGANLNFSKQDTVLMLSHLAHEAGPPKEPDSSTSGPSSDHLDVLGVVHCALLDSAFVQCLLAQLRVKFSSIRDNWRETNAMELLVTLLFRVYSLVQDSDLRNQAFSLLELARSTTLNWIDMLRNEIATTADSENARRASMYAFRAALLCRQTFSVFIDNPSRGVEPHDLLCFVKASAALQQSFVVDVDTLGSSERAMLKRDIVMAHELHVQIHDAIQAYPKSLSEGICFAIGLVDGSDQFSPWEFYDNPNAGWVGAVMHPTTPDAIPQKIDFHCTEGHVLVHGKTMGKLPDDIRDSEPVKELFQGKHLLTYPSHLQGMSHRLVASVENQTVHFGVDKGVVTIVAESRWVAYEFIPRRIFRSSNGVYDLPRGLVDDCCHWFNRATQLVEIRRASKWKHKHSEWTLDVVSRTTQRNRVNLVDPHSHIALILRNMFNHFEDGQRLTIYQPQARKGTLSVELRHLDLSFFVNKNGRLVCQQLNAEIDQHQDAGTLYGYRSMIVLRDCIDSTSRSIIFPLGNLIWKIDGVHVDVQTEIDLGPRGRNLADGQAGKAYARFGIDNTLGRLTCPPEPRLLYTKALLHAVTSCDVPDPLTGRTGEEEAVHTLLSGRCQPWIPFSEAYSSLFDQLRSLAPKRAFYPPEKRVLQQVTWDPYLPPYLQNDRYGRLVRTLLDKSDNLSQVTDNSVLGQTLVASKRKREDYAQVLELRGELQRHRFQCSPVDLDSDCPVANEDLLYKSRGCLYLDKNESQSESERVRMVLQVVKLLRGKSKQVPMAKEISNILEGWSWIGGFGKPFSVTAMPISALVDGSTVGEIWGGLVAMCQQAPPLDVMLILAQLCFAPGADPDTIHLLAAYSYLPDLSVPTPPSQDNFLEFKFDEAPTETSIIGLIATAYVGFKYKPGLDLTTRVVQEAEMAQQRTKHEQECSSHGLELSKIILDQWPAYKTITSRGFTSDFINVPKALATVQTEWKRLMDNRDLSLYLRELQKALSTYRTLPRNTTNGKRGPSNFVSESEYCLRSYVSSAVPALSRDLVCRAMSLLPDTANGQLEPFAPVSQSADVTDKGHGGSENETAYFSPPEFMELRQIVSPLAGSSDPMRQAYGTDLAGSLDALEKLDKQQWERTASVSEPAPTLADVSAQMARAEAKLALTWGVLEAAFSSVRNVSVEQRAQPQNWLKMVALWPRLTPVSLLELLRSSSGHIYGENVQSSLVSYGCALTKLQRLQRMRRALQKGDKRCLNDELCNPGHTNWRPIDVPDWLLLEIDANLLIRAEQVDVARAIIDPESKSNSVLQLNMGKGKTSVIVPMVISVLADGQQMCRLVVPKALLLPTAQPVQSQLGGLVGRELRHVPFSRRLIARPDIDRVVEIFKSHHDDLLRTRGVLLAAPEHVLAFKLSSLQCVVDGKQIASEMDTFQMKLTNGLCRDILDESDFTLAVRTQLVYPSGQLTTVDGAPYRWKLVETLLSLVEDSLADLCTRFPHCISSLPRPGGGFPIVYVLQAGIEGELNRRIMDGICNGRTPFFRPAPDKYETKWAKSRRVVSPGNFQRIIERALSADGTDADVDEIAELFSDAQSAANGLALVRGLLHDSILITCLKKQWNVHYGLHPKRWPIAVPFEAKGVPSERSEFGHPDVSIILTCLSFYYTGLNKSQFREGLQHVLHHADDPATEYEQWTAGNTGTPLPIELRSWNAVNVDDAGQLQLLWDHLRFTRPVVDHYLNTFVFPVHSRQFAVKLQASAWDLPLFPLPLQEEKLQTFSQVRTTGFSGTNDSKMMLPLTIKQEDLPSLRQTNAEVLTYLLQARSRRYIRTGSDGRRWAEESLLKSLWKNKIRVFIDAGAYILEKNNEALARAWLRVDYQAAAAVFFGEDNRSWVVFQNASIDKAPLVATPFVDKLDSCLVYFDEAHTRGVDLQLPADARGALTLTLGQTKDHTVQAAMRLRQLGSTQSVVFYAPPEVDRSIRDACGQNGKPYDGTIGSPQVIRWLLEQTCMANQQLQPLYKSHGMDFCRRLDALQTYGNWKTSRQACQSLLKVLEQPERQTIQQLYGTKQSVPRASGKSIRVPMLQAFMGELNGLHRSDTTQSTPRGRGHTNGAFEEVEQEREVEHQVEQVRMPERRTKFQGLPFPGVCKAIRKFVYTGVLSGGKGYKQVFAYISQTHIGKRYGVQETNSRLFVSAEFERTIKQTNNWRAQDDFMRRVEWLLWSTSTETGVVVIPEEMEELLPILQTSKGQVHLVAYSTPVTRSMQAFSRLRFYALPALPEKYTLPTWLVVELGILAGRLYMSFDEAVSMSQYLCRATELGKPMDSDNSSSAAWQPFCPDPIGFLLEWLPLLRATQDIMHTPAAYVCQGRTLDPDHAFFAHPGVVVSIRGKPSSSPDGVNVDDSGSDGDGGGGAEWVEDVHEEIDGA